MEIDEKGDAVSASPSSVVEMRACVTCEGDIVPPRNKTGRPKLYCSEKCRRKAGSARYAAKKALVGPPMRTCRFCVSMFPGGQRGGSQFCSVGCRASAKRENSRKHRERNRIRGNVDPDRARVYQLKQTLRRNYGLTLDDYRQMELAQGGTCAICGREPGAVKGDRRLSVDHCHKTGKVRSLLCRHCNSALGLFQDSPARLRRAAEYLELAA